MRRRIPGTLVATSADLLDRSARQTLQGVFGYKWIRPIVRPWADTLRNPVTGQLFEITRYEMPGAVPLLSEQANRAIRKLCA
jgi:hypothetical protein